MRTRALTALALASLILAACSPAAQPAAPTAPPVPATKPPAAPTTGAAAVASPAAKPTLAAAPSPTTAAAPQAAKPSPASSPAASAVSISGPFEGEAKTLNGAGATFPAVLYSKWFNEYEKVTGVKVNYQSIGSGGGIKSIQDQTVDFAGSDAPMSDQQLAAAKGGELYHVPAALGAVVPTYNLPNVTGTLKFTPETLVGIYTGAIKKWNDPKLVADNPSLANASGDIVVVYRSDGSGTTSIWVDYLSTVSKEWESSVGRGTSVKFPTGIGAKGNEGVAGEVKANPNAIGYVELIYAIQNKLGVGFVKNKSGEFVEPSLQSVTAAAAGVANTIKPDLRASIVNAEGRGAYPISGFTWLLAYKNMNDPAKGLALTRMLWWATHEAQRFNTELGYAPIPIEIVAKSEAMIRQIAVDGKPIFPGR